MEEAKPRKRRGCVIAAIVAAFLGLGVIMAIPGIPAVGRSSYHQAAAGTLKTISSAEADFRSNDRDDNQVNDFWVGDVSQLYLRKGPGGQIRLIELSVAMADGSPWAPLPDTRAIARYRYAAIKIDGTGVPYDRGGGRNPDRFAFCAYPETYQAMTWYRSSADLTQFTFIVNEQNIIWKKDLGGAPAVKWPKDPLAEGWTKLD